MNATVFAYGMAKGGRDGARQALFDFWKRVSDAASNSPLRPTPLDRKPLRDVGRRSAEDWLNANFDRVGRESTVDIKGVYL